MQESGTMVSPSTTQVPLNIVVLISGSGTNLQALIKSVPKFKNPSARISLVISNSKFAGGIQRAQAANPPIPVEVFSLATFRKNHPDIKEETQLRSQYDRELALLTKSGQPNLVILAGFMHVLSAEFLKEMNASCDSADGHKIPVINLHPALPGQFDGTNAIRRAWEAGPDGRKEITKTGVMVHEVIPEVDKGPVILEATVSLKEGESLEAFEERMHQAEHILIVAATWKVLVEAHPHPLTWDDM